MKKLKIILQSRFLYLFILGIALIIYFIFNNLNYVSVYTSFVNERFTITNITIKDYGYKIDLKGKEKVIGYIYSEDISISNIDLGDKIEVVGDIIDISNNTVPNTFNYKEYLESNEIYNVIEITSIKKVEDNKNIFYLIKSKLLDRGKKLDKSYPYISSLIFGNNSYLDEDVLSSYRENGISHLFAISGLHISIFIGILSYLLDKIKVSFVLKSFILIFFLLFYMFFTNFSMSVMRGAIFTILLFLNKLLKLEISSINLLLLSLSIILFSNPLNLNNVGLEYSFLVTLFLIKFSNIINGGKVKNLFLISFIAFLVSYPITINNFNQVNFLSIIYNIFFVPYVSSILLPFTMISYVFPFLDNILFLLIKIIELSSQFLNSIDILKVSMCKMNVLMIVIYFVLICRLFFKWSCKKVKYLTFIVLFFVVHFFMPFKRDNYIMFFDVGQGDSTFISIDNSYTLIDTGGFISYDGNEYSYKISKNKFLPYFKSNGIRKLNNLILTHGDADHMKEAYYIVSNFNVLNVYFNSNEMNYEEKRLYKLCMSKGINVHLLKKDDFISGRGYKLVSVNNIYDDENDSSIVLYGNVGKYKVLFTGDASKKVELNIINEYPIEDIDILKVGHHGSKTSSSALFISEVSPKYSVISVGKNNRFGHPSGETLDVLKDYKVYRTDVDGSIIFDIEGDSLNVKTYRP